MSLNNVLEWVLLLNRDEFEDVIKHSKLFHLLIKLVILSNYNQVYVFNNFNYDSNLLSKHNKKVPYFSVYNGPQPLMRYSIILF